MLKVLKICKLIVFFALNDYISELSKGVVN